MPAVLSLLGPFGNHSALQWVS